MPPIPIVPRFKLMMKFDIQPEKYEPYYRYILSEFMPGLQAMQVYPFMIWHIAYGNYPIRQLEFVVESMDVIKDAFASDQWKTLEDQLKTYTVNYERKIVPFKEHFQF